MDLRISEQQGQVQTQDVAAKCCCLGRKLVSASLLSFTGIAATHKSMNVQDAVNQNASETSGGAGLACSTAEDETAKDIPRGSDLGHARLKFLN